MRSCGTQSRQGYRRFTRCLHHASEGAHHDGVWGEMLERNPLAIVTPWAKGDRFLPLEKDLERLRVVSDKVFVTSMPALKRVKKDRAVEKLIRKLHGEDLSELRAWGQVRARRRTGEAEWRVELDGDARRVPG